MPLKDFKCEKCNYREEFLVYGDSIKHCPVCEMQLVEQFPNRVNFKLTGTGFYETDYKPKKYVNPTEEKPKKKSKKERTEELRKVVEDTVIKK